MGKRVQFRSKVRSCNRLPVEASGALQQRGHLTFAVTKVMKHMPRKTSSRGFFARESYRTGTTEPKRENGHQKGFTQNERTLNTHLEV